MYIYIYIHNYIYIYIYIHPPNTIEFASSLTILGSETRKPLLSWHFSKLNYQLSQS